MDSRNSDMFKKRAREACGDGGAKSGGEFELGVRRTARPVPRRAFGPIFVLDPHARRRRARPLRNGRWAPHDQLRPRGAAELGSLTAMGGDSGMAETELDSLEPRLVLRLEAASRAG